MRKRPLLLCRTQKCVVFMPQETVLNKDGGYILRCCGCFDSANSLIPLVTFLKTYYLVCPTYLQLFYTFTAAFLQLLHLTSNKLDSFPSVRMFSTYTLPLLVLSHHHPSPLSSHPDSSTQRRPGGSGAETSQVPGDVQPGQSQRRRPQGPHARPYRQGRQTHTALTWPSLISPHVAWDPLLTTVSVS